MNTGQAPEANSLPVPKDKADLAMDAAACIGCGACIAACPNAAAMLFTSAKISQFALLPQGRPEAAKRALAMVAKMDELGFGNCTNHRECEMRMPQGHFHQQHCSYEPGIYQRRSLVSGKNPGLKNLAFS